MDTTMIPPNNPEAPRWLLDLEEWKILPFADIPQEKLDIEGYGIVSYTWGYIQEAKPASDPPRGLFWDVPAVTRWPLSTARRVMETIGCRYIWWDWMCVPQRGTGLRELSPELLRVQAEEIEKQMHIYGKARKSIVWLHSTSWTEESPLKVLLSLKSPDGENSGSEDMRQHVEQIMLLLDAAREKEYWLCSGWTLQEGVLLHETNLIDGNGSTLPGADFWMSDQATVSDLTIPMTKLAHELAIGYFIKTQGYEPDMGVPSPPTAYLLSKMPPNWLRRSLQFFMSSGFVGFWKQNPLGILSGKRSRIFRHDKDRCWALLGALGIDDIEVTYDKNVTMEEVKRRLVQALIDKYSWEMLMLPYPEFQLREGKGLVTIERGFRWTDLADGVMLPVSLFAVEQQPPPHSFVPALPTLSYTHDLRIKSNPGERITLYSASPDGKAWFRHYRQDKDGLHIVSSNDIAFDEDTLLSSSWLLLLHYVNMEAGVLGRRCLVLVNLNHGTSNEPARAGFGGILDLKGLGEQRVEVDEIILNSSP